MRKIKELTSNKRKQYLVLAFILVGAVGMVGILNYFDPLIFNRYLGELNPCADSSC